MSGLTRYEKETIILTNEADDYYEVYTFNSALKKESVGLFQEASKSLQAEGNNKRRQCHLCGRQGQAVSPVDRAVQ